MGFFFVYSLLHLLANCVSSDIVSWKVNLNEGGWVLGGGGVHW